MSKPFYMIRDEELDRAAAVGRAAKVPDLERFAHALREAIREHTASVAERKAMIELALEARATV